MQARVPRSVKATAVKLLALVLAVIALTACSAHPTRDRNAPAPPAHRIVSLMPSLTEDLCAIGARTQLAGVSEYSDGACVAGVPVVASFTSVDAERVVQLRPDVVVGIPAQEAMTQPLRHAGIRTALLKDDSYADLFDDITALGALSGHSAQAQKLEADLRKQTAALRASEHFKREPRVFFVVQVLPIWTAGPQSYISTLIQFAGGRNAVSMLPQAYAEYNSEALVRLQPDVLIASKDAQLQTVIGRQPWRSLSAVREHRVYILNDDAILVQPGPRYNQGLQWLIERLRPLAK